LEVDRRSGAGEVHDRIDLAGHPQVGADVVVHEGEAGATEQRLDVGDGPGDEVVEADDLVPSIEQPVAEVGAEEASPAGDDYAAHQLRPMPSYSNSRRRRLVRSRRLRPSTTRRAAMVSPTLSKSSHLNS